MLYRPNGGTATLPTSAYRRSARRHFEQGRRCAALRALTGARLFLVGMVPTMTAAAEATGSNTIYVSAAVVVLKTEDRDLERAILDGKVRLPDAARALKRAANLLDAYRAADAADKFVVVHAITAGVVGDELISPLRDGVAAT
jgi:hypothetical protein